MTGYHGGQIVKEGFYLKHSTWEFEFVAGEGSILPGNEETRYRRVPLPAVVVGGPLMGLAYVISLPIVFCFAFGYLLTCRVGQKLKMARR